MPTLVAEPETIPRGEQGGDRPERGKKLGLSSRRPRGARASSIVLAGTSFKTSSLALREALLARLDRDSSRLRELLRAKEYAQVVTCNRIEMVVATDSPEASEKAIVAWLSKTPGMGPGRAVIREDADAILHLFRVAAGLDSMVVGEDQILSQVRDAGVAARRPGSSSGTLSALFDASVNVGRRVREGLVGRDESVSSVALSLALRQLPRGPKGVLLIGTGKTTRLAAKQLGGAKIYVATRRASVSSFSGATFVSHKELRRVAAKCDLIISATKHSGYVLKKGDLDGRARVVLDLAFPRNVDPALDSGHTRVYNLEDLAKVFSSKSRPVSQEARLAEQMVAAEAESFSRWLLASRQSSALSRVYRWAEATRVEETAAALRRLPDLTEREQKVVEAMGRRLVSKLLSGPARFAKSSTPELPQEQRLDLIQRVFAEGETR